MASGLSGWGIDCSSTAASISGTWRGQLAKLITGCPIRKEDRVTKRGNGGKAAQRLFHPVRHPEGHSGGLAECYGVQGVGGTRFWPVGWRSRRRVDARC